MVQNCKFFPKKYIWLTLFVKVEIKKKCYWKCWLRPSNRLNQQIKPHPTRWHYPLINYFNQTQVLAYQNFKNKTPAVWHRCHTPFIRHHIFNSIPVILPNGWKIYWGFYTFWVSHLNISIKLIDSLKFIQSEKAAKVWKKISQFYLTLHFQIFWPSQNILTLFYFLPSFWNFLITSWNEKS